MASPSDPTDQLFYASDPEVDLLYLLIDDPDLRQVVIGEVSGEDFVKEEHAVAFRQLTGTSEPVSAILQRLAAVDRRTFRLVNDLWGYSPRCGLPSPRNVLDYARMVRSGAIRRDLHRITRAEESGLNGGEVTLPDGTRLQAGSSHEDVIAACQTARRAVQARGRGQAWATMDDALQDAITSIQDRIQGRVTALPSHLPALDSLLGGGVGPGQLMVVAGPPGGGKTAFALHLARIWAGHMGEPGAVVSLEMRKGELAGRFLTMESGVEGSRMLRAEYLSDVHKRAIWDARKRMANWPIRFLDASGVTGEHVRAAARPLWGAEQLKWLVVDYLTLMRTPAGMERASKADQVGANCTALKQVALEFGIPVVLLSQLNRQGQREAELTLSALRDSGQVEQDADKVVFLQAAEGDQITITLAKNRQGACGALQTTFDRARMRWGAQ